MSATYSGDPSSNDKDAVRFLIKDTGPAFDIQDEEIDFLLNVEANYWMASAILCDKLAVIKSGGGLASKSVGGLSESYSQGSLQFYQENGKAYRARGSTHKVPTIGEVKQVFSMKQFDSPWAIQPKIKEDK